jgi:hypothetical protein
MSILSIVSGAIGPSIFHALGTTRGVVREGVATSELRRGLSWLAEDSKMATTTSLVDGAAPVSNVTFSWTDKYQGAGIAHTSSYAMVSGRLVRTYDGSSHTVAQGVVSLAFSRSGQSVIAAVEVTSNISATRTLSVQSVMRPKP